MSTSKLIVRYATADDAGLIADMSRKTFADTFAENNTQEDMDIFMNEVFTKEALMKEVGAPGNTFLLVYDENMPVGYARLREGASHPEFGNRRSMELARLYVVQSYIGKGAGRLLMLRSIETAIELGAQILWLGVWEKNERGILFYKKFGFKKFDTHQFILGKDVQTDHLMMKELMTATPA
jgi:GNAT superfamily N-acetyltransferase